MISKKLVAFISAFALTASGPALAQASAADAMPQRAAPALTDDSTLRGEDGIGWGMAAGILAGVVLVLVLIYLVDDDDDEDDDDNEVPTSP